jgi:gamma-glutamylcyclotransferase (GGCT)/AIG2-like uncharacterized protein YtfP
MRVSTSNSPSPLNFLFVYGTLRIGEMRHHMLAAGRILTIIPASVAGQLLDLGAYPGLVHGEKGSRVQGELVGFQAFAQIGNLFCLQLSHFLFSLLRRDTRERGGLFGYKCGPGRLEREFKEVLLSWLKGDELSGFCPLCAYHVLPGR